MRAVRGAAGLFAVAGVVLLAACASAGPATPQVSLPDVGRTPAVELDSEQMAVARGVVEYHRLLQEAMRGEAIGASQWTAVATRSWSQRIENRLRQAAGQHRTVRGQADHTPRTITVAGDTATYRECLDPKGMRSVRNGAVLPDGAVRLDTAAPGKASLWRTVTLVRAGKTWKVAEVRDAGPCAASSTTRSSR